MCCHVCSRLLSVRLSLEGVNLGHSKPLPSVSPRYPILLQRSPDAALISGIWLVSLSAPSTCSDMSNTMPPLVTSSGSDYSLSACCLLHITLNGIYSTLLPDVFSSLLLFETIDLQPSHPSHICIFDMSFLFLYNDANHHRIRLYMFLYCIYWT